MHERLVDLALEDLLDRDYPPVGRYLLSIITSQRRLSASQVAANRLTRYATAGPDNRHR